MKEEKQKWSKKDWYMFAVEISYIPAIAGVLFMFVGSGIDEDYILAVVKYWIMELGRIFVLFGLSAAAVSLSIVGNIFSHEIDESQKKDIEIMNLKIEIEKLKKDNRFSENEKANLAKERESIFLGHIKGENK